MFGCDRSRSNAIDRLAKAYPGPTQGRSIALGSGMSEIPTFGGYWSHHLFDGGRGVYWLHRLFDGGWGSIGYTVSLTVVVALLVTPSL